MKFRAQLLMWHYEAFEELQDILARWVREDLGNEICKANCGLDFIKGVVKFEGKRIPAREFVQENPFPPLKEGWEYRWWTPVGSEMKVSGEEVVVDGNHRTKVTVQFEGRRHSLHSSDMMRKMASWLKSQEVEDCYEIEVESSRPDLHWFDTVQE